MTPEAASADTALAGRFDVRRASGFLPPWISKTIERDGWGWTRWLGLPLFRFRVLARTGGGAELRYVLLPVRDELLRDGAQWFGRGMVFGREFCTFWLVPRVPSSAAAALSPEP